MQLKGYQEECLRALREYFAQVAAVETNGERYAAKAAWEELYKNRWYKRLEGFPEGKPFVCLKVPTGGGKTLLAAHAVDIAQEYLKKKHEGLVLWVVPTQQIYKQTLKALQTKDHPYRQVLDRASAGRTIVIEKHERFTVSDVEGNLIVLVMMMQSTARETKDFLRMYRDAEFTAFFPSEERLDLHRKLLERFPMLDVHTEFDLKQIKSSLGNVIRLLEPIVILDEGHRAKSLLAQKTLAKFNPRAIIEFTATPHEGSNVLVGITGKQLLAEEMVKLPINIRNIENPDWKDSLSAAITRLDELRESAVQLEAKSGEYIRPICLIQVERTGRDQRARGFIHSEEVKEELLKHRGIKEYEIAIQSSEKKDLNEFEDANGLLTKNNHVRFIITKDALKEGWDCSFAYVLCLLNTPKSRTGATQLIGRILRQPYAKKTGVDLLDQAFVVSHRNNNVINDIKKGFDEEGLIDLKTQLRIDYGTNTEGKSESAGYSQHGIRKQFQKAVKHFILPTFVYVSGKKPRPLDYEADILSRVNWDVVELADWVTNKFRFQDDTLVNTEDALSVTDDETVEYISHYGEVVNTFHEVTPEYLAGEIMNVVPNPWMAYELCENVLALLREKEPNEAKLRHNLYHIADSLRVWLRERKDELAREIFFDLMKKDVIRFVYFTDSWKPRQDINIPEEAEPMQRRSADGKWGPVQQSLFEPEAVISDDYNTSEREVAIWLDKQEKLFFWLRNYTSKESFFLQGWRPHRLYPDFISTTRKPDGSYGIDKVFVIESKGTHLASNPKTEYIQAIFDKCNEAKPKHISELGFEMNSKPISFEVLQLHDWENKLTALFEGE